MVRTGRIGVDRVDVVVHHLCDESADGLSVRCVEADVPVKSAAVVPQDRSDAFGAGAVHPLRMMDQHVVFGNNVPHGNVPDDAQRPAHGPRRWSRRAGRAHLIEGVGERTHWGRPPICPRCRTEWRWRGISVRHPRAASRQSRCRARRAGGIALSERCAPRRTHS